MPVNKEKQSSKYIGLMKYSEFVLAFEPKNFKFSMLPSVHGPSIADIK